MTDNQDARLTRRRFLSFLPVLAAAPLAQWPITPDPAPDPGADTLVELSQRMAKIETDSLVHYANEETLFGFVHEHGRALIELFERTPGPTYFWPARPRRA